MKKIFFGIIVGMLLSCSISYAATELNVVPNPFLIFINNETSSIEAYNINGYTYGKWADIIKDVNKALGQETLTLKFDKDKREIHLNVIKTEAEAEEIITTQPIRTGENNMNVPLNKYGLPDFSNYTGEKPTINHKERNNYFTFNGVKYISIANYSEDCDDNLLPSNYRFEQTFVDDKLSGIIQFTTINTETHKITILIKEVPYTYFHNYYFEYDYYINTILPLIK